MYFIPISYRKEEDFINVANVLIKMLEEKNEFDDVVFSLGRRSSEFMNRRCYIVEDKNDLLRQLKNDLRLHGGNNNDKFVCIKFLSCDVKYLLDTFFENELEDDYENKWDEFLLGICSETEDIGNLYTIENGENMFCSKDAINKFYELMEYLYKERKMAINFDFLYKNTGWKQIKTYNYPLNKKKFWVDVKKQNESVSTNQITKINLVDVDIEKIVLDTIKNVLEVTQISLDDDFYELGGDSLLAIDVLDELKKRGVDCKLQELLESRTIGEFVDSFTCREMKGGDERDSSSRYKEILKNNKITERVVISKTNKQNILLIGATGFLGIHLLRELVDKPFVNKIYCLNRGKDVEEASKKLQKKLEYYFDDMLASRIKEKLTVICGDVVKEGLGIVKDGLVKLSDEVDVVINSSGIVKHYGRYEEFYNANVKAVCNLLEFSKYSNSEYIHMSTLAISGNNGMGTDINFENKIEFTEKDFDIGQPLDNPYVKSKYEAEKIVLNAIEQGIKAKIFRIGNLTNRKNDGVFQINFETDAFTQRMLLLLNFKMFPVSLLDYEFEFTPVDEAAKAIVSILEYRNEISNVFHINNDPILGNDLCSKLKEIGFPIKLHKDFEFVEQLHKESSKRKNPFMKEIIVNDINKSQFTYKSCFAYKNDFSKWYLEQLGFSWEKTDGDYLSKYIKYYIDKNVINKED